MEPLGRGQHVAVPKRPEFPEDDHAMMGARKKEAVLF
jgi:hypothetical protein